MLPSAHHDSISSRRRADVEPSGFAKLPDITNGRTEIAVSIFDCGSQQTVSRFSPWTLPTGAYLAVFAAVGVLTYVLSGASWGPPPPPSAKISSAVVRLHGAQVEPDRIRRRIAAMTPEAERDSFRMEVRPEAAAGAMKVTIEHRGLPEANGPAEG